MYDTFLIIDELRGVKDLLYTVQDRTQHITSADGFFVSPDGMIVLDAVCMNFIAIGEVLKAIDKRTNKQLFPLYPAIPWKDVMGMRDIIAHHYFEVDAEEIFRTLKESVPPLIATIEQMIGDLTRAGRGL